MHGSVRAHENAMPDDARFRISPETGSYRCVISDPFNCQTKAVEKTRNAVTIKVTDPLNFWLQR
jgi:hypothetical protein